MIYLTAEEIANLVINFWDTFPVSKHFERCHSLDEVLRIAEYLMSEEEEKKYYKFLEALRKYVIDFLSGNIDYAGSSLTFDVDPAFSDAFYWLACTYELDLPLLPVKHTLLIVKEFTEHDKNDKTLKVTIQTKKGHEAPWLKQHYGLANSPKIHARAPQK